MLVPPETVLLEEEDDPAYVSISKGAFIGSGVMSQVQEGSHLILSWN